MKLTGGSRIRSRLLGSYDSSYTMIFILLAALAFIVLYPIGIIFVNSLYVTAADGSVSFGYSAWKTAFNQPGMAEAMLNTLKVVVTVQLISFPIAIVIAWTLARTDVPASRWLEFGFWASFLLPSLVTTTGWLLLLDPDYGLLNTYLMKTGLFESSPFNMYSFWGIIFAHLVSNSISVKVMLLTPAFRNLNSSIEEASRVCGGSVFSTLLRIVLPVLTPALLVTFLMSLIKGLEAFEIELVLGTSFDFSVYSTKMYQILRGSPPDYATSTVLATAILGIMIPLIIFQQWATTRRSYVTVTGQYRQNVMELGAWRWVVTAVLAAVIFITTVVPVILQFAGSLMTLFGFFDLPKVWSLQHWRDALADVTFLRGLRNTLFLGLSTSLIGVLIFAIIAYCSVRIKKPWSGCLDLLSWLPFTIPGVILGLGYLWMVLKVPVFSPLYGTMGVLILVSILVSMTLGVQMLKSTMLQLGKDVEEAGRIVGGSWFKTFRNILLPLLAPSIAVVAIMVFASTARQVSTIVLLHSSNTTPLSVLQLEFLYGGNLGPAAVVGSVIVMISFVVALCALFLSSKFSLSRSHWKGD